MPTRRDILKSLTLALPLTAIVRPLAAQGAWQPSKPIEFLVMAGPGGGADLAVRFLVKIIEDNRWCPVPFTVRHLPANGGADALLELNRRGGDAHVLLFTLNSFYTAPLSKPELGLDISRFAPIARMSEDTFLLWVSSRRTDIATFDDFLEAVRAAGPSWTMGGTGRDSEDQLLTDFLNASYGLKMSYKSYAGGGDVAAALAADEVQSTVNNPSEVHAQLAGRTVKSVASFTSQRLPAFLRTPALRETGMTFSYFMQRSIVGPPDLMEPALAWYIALFEKVYDSLEWQTYRRDNSLIGNLISGDELTAYWLAEREKHKRWLEAMRAMRG
ncbi:MAG: Bug family tripartite tricarboxylate transporter substrate binding protein [Hyphomicrobiaceae bacterium]|jgi:tripartite-type tricarboxylate transporter receptor subunit TctC